MKKLTDLTSSEARHHFLKGTSYFNGDLPKYLSFEKLLAHVSEVLAEKSFREFQSSNPADLSGVNYNFIANKDGKFSWRPYELMHPAIYVSLVNCICDPESWALIQSRVVGFERGIVECCSSPVMSIDHQSDTATQISSWWQKVEQRSLVYSLEYSHLLHTDVTDCYGSLYTHSIAWALHGVELAKSERRNKDLIGNKIDFHIQASRYGQTNGISQGSFLMDFIAELVLGFVDEQINQILGTDTDIKILRYRDDYRIFANSDERAEEVLKIVSDSLRIVGMKLGVSKTFLCRNIINGSIKPDKLAGIELQDLGATNAKTIQKQLMRLHSFGLKFTNSGALRRLVGEFHSVISKQKVAPDDLDVQVAIATDIGFVSPQTFPVVAGILSHLISLSASDSKVGLWQKVESKMSRVPYNGYLQIWLQRVTKPLNAGIQFESEEPICQIVNGKNQTLWNSSWISSALLMQALDVKQIVVSDANSVAEVIQPEEVELFKQKALAY